MTVRVWNSQSGKLLNELKGHSGMVNSVAISQDGTTIVSGLDDMTVRMWSDQTSIINNYQLFCIRTFNELGLLHKLSETNLNLVVDDWIVNSGRKLFWLPPSFRPANLQVIAINDTTVAIGTALGKMVTIS
ncbi:hypothetical protein BDQ17DRAFT_478908 [Cyathus striatus]|nr:hypothetical protein BDQ17DRAFT_478908 [Cyathus striatus]